MIFYIISQVAGWIATFLRAGGMLAKDSMTVKWLVSGGNALWMISGICTGNAPLITSNAICLLVMAVEIIRTRKEKQDGQRTVKSKKSSKQNCKKI